MTPTINKDIAHVSGKWWTLLSKSASFQTFSE